MVHKMVNEFEIKTLPAQPALLIRAHTSARELGKMLVPAFAAIRQYLETLTEQPAGAPFAAYYNDDMQNLDVGIGVPVARALPAHDTIQAGEIPAGEYAMCLYTGPYAHLSEAYRALAQWLEENGRHTTRAAYEIYLDDAAATPHAELRTRVMQPLA